MNVPRCVNKDSMLQTSPKTTFWEEFCSFPNKILFLRQGRNICNKALKLQKKPLQ